MRLMLLSVLLTAGCQHARLNGVDQMLEHPQFQAAAQAAPQFTTEVMKKLAEYEYELERR
tara:strand:- start:3860 stop:4039 length:180 start_codon:yes stop_codon:yes gene_type:complete